MIQEALSLAEHHGLFYMFPMIRSHEMTIKVHLGLKDLAKIESRLNSDGIKVKTEALDGGCGLPACKITEYAKKNCMELIIMGTHGYTGLKKLINGSVASRVFNSSLVPVLVIRPESCHL